MKKIRLFPGWLIKLDILGVVSFGLSMFINVIKTAIVGALSLLPFGMGSKVGGALTVPLSFVSSILKPIYSVILLITIVYLIFALFRILMLRIKRKKAFMESDSVQAMGAKHSGYNTPELYEDTRRNLHKSDVF